MNLLDAGVLVVAGLAAVNGYRRGAAMQVIAYLGLIGGLVLGALLAPRLAGLGGDAFSRATIALTSLLVIAAAGDLLGWLIGRSVHRAAQQSRLGSLDATLGGFVGLAAVLLATWFLAFNLIGGPFPALARQIQGSAIVRALAVALPPPPSILTQVRGFLKDFGFPDVFSGLPPAPAGPVRGPSRGEVADAVGAADQSTLKVVGVACDRLVEGSGFLVDRRYLVTNAHVVAGVDRPQAQQQGGASIEATTVLFDPRLDLAVLRLASGAADPLALLEGDLDRGAKGAVLGYPGGGPLTGSTAAVRRRLDAVGRDIYGKGEVEREVYELQTDVHPGSSGGPFVALDGRVAGVVFAASTTDPTVGYALTGSQAGPQIRRALGRTKPVDTGPCIE